MLALCYKLIQCPICLRSYKDPRTLGCGHSFCFLCIKSLPTRNGNIACRLCGTIANVSSDPLNKLHGMTRLVHLMNNRNAYSAQSDYETFPSLLLICRDCTILFPHCKLHFCVQHQEFACSHRIPEQPEHQRCNWTMCEVGVNMETTRLLRETDTVESSMVANELSEETRIRIRTQLAQLTQQVRYFHRFCTHPALQAVALTVMDEWLKAISGSVGKMARCLAKPVLNQDHMDEDYAAAFEHFCNNVDFAALLNVGSPTEDKSIGSKRQHQIQIQAAVIPQPHGVNRQDYNGHIYQTIDEYYIELNSFPENERFAAQSLFAAIVSESVTSSFKTLCAALVARFDAWWLDRHTKRYWYCIASFGGVHDYDWSLRAALRAVFVSKIQVSLIGSSHYPARRLKLGKDLPNMMSKYIDRCQDVSQQPKFIRQAVEKTCGGKWFCAAGEHSIQLACSSPSIMETRITRNNRTYFLFRC